MNNKYKFLPVALIVIFVDQGSKFLASLLNFQITYNSGVSFSMMAKNDPKFITFMLGLIIYFLFHRFRKFWKKDELASGLFFGGAVANIFDRLFFDAVRDWINIPFTQIHNNLADWAIFIGLFLMLYPMVMKKANNESI